MDSSLYPIDIYIGMWHVDRGYLLLVDTWSHLSYVSRVCVSSAFQFVFFIGLTRLITSMCFTGLLKGRKQYKNCITRELQHSVFSLFTKAIIFVKIPFTSEILNCSNIWKHGFNSTFEIKVKLGACIKTSKDYHLVPTDLTFYSAIWNNKFVPYVNLNSL